MDVGLFVGSLGEEPTTDPSPVLPGWTARSEYAPEIGLSNPTELIGAARRPWGPGTTALQVRTCVGMVVRTRIANSWAVSGSASMDRVPELVRPLTDSTGRMEVCES
jgi:hypothetical protein